MRDPAAGLPHRATSRGSNNRRVVVKRRADCNLPLHGAVPTLDEFKTVGEGVAGFEAGAARNRDGLGDQAPGFFEAGSPRVEVHYLVGDVRLRQSSIDSVLDPDMDLLITDPEPESAPTHQRRRLLYLGQPEHAAVEGAGDLLLPDRNRDLHMVNAFDGHL
jgi:hypothetical protein